MRFQSTHSLRSATIHHAGDGEEYLVSIHALLAECDCLTPCTLSTYKSFNPRTPCGVRPVKYLMRSRYKKFQSTHSLRSATKSERYLRSLLTVSIHALLAECDSGIFHQLHDEPCFNPRTPCGVRLAVHMLISYTTLFQSTHSLRSATVGLFTAFSGGRCFNPRTPCGVRLYAVVPSASDWMFQSTHSLRSATTPV